MRTYVQNYGMTKTIINKNNKKSQNEIKWVGDYDGNLANIAVAIDDNGQKEGFQMQLNNDDLLNLLNVPSVQKPIDERLMNDFLQQSSPPVVLENLVSTPSKMKRRKTRKHNIRRSKIISN
jgi:hypothetical protein